MLSWQTLKVARSQYGFSWWDSLRLATHAARAAFLFRRGSDGPCCLAELQSYYSIIRSATRATFDAAEAARLDLEWWRERRRNLPPEEYARTIAKLTASLYDLPEELALEPATIRAQAMAYRDARRDGRMTDADWMHVGKMLEDAYGRLKEALSTSQPR